MVLVSASLFNSISVSVGYLMPNPSCTGCLKIDATHLYDNDLLLRQVQRGSFGRCLVKNASFHQMNVFINSYYISFQDMQSFF